MDIIPGELVGNHDIETEFRKILSVGDKVKVAVNSAFNSDKTHYMKTGTIEEIDKGDEWAYKVRFEDGEANWYKRYILRKI